jgi:hypothetical protein
MPPTRNFDIAILDLGPQTAGRDVRADSELLYGNFSISARVALGIGAGQRRLCPPPPQSPPHVSTPSPGGPEGDSRAPARAPNERPAAGQVARSLTPPVRDGPELEGAART